MAFTPKRLAQFVAATAETSHYTVPATTLAVVKNVVVANTSTNPVTCSLSIVPAGNVAGVANRVIPGTTIPPGAVVPFDMTQVMAAGDFISAIASVAASLTVTISGMEELGSNGLSSGTVIGSPPLWGSPVATGDANADGVLGTLPRADHIHKGILAVDQYGVPIATGNANAAGTSLLLPRADHVHKGVVAADQLATAAPVDVSTVAAAVGASALLARADHAHLLPPGDWIALPFQNGWGNYPDAMWADAAYCKDPFGWVHFRGLISGGTATNETVITTLPVGYRTPTGQGHHQSVVTNGAWNFVRIRDTGTIVCGSGISNAWIDISTIRYRAV